MQRIKNHKPNSMSIGSERPRVITNDMRTDLRSRPNSSLMMYDSFAMIQILKLTLILLCANLPWWESQCSSKAASGAYCYSNLTSIVIEKTTLVSILDWWASSNENCLILEKNFQMLWKDLKRSWRKTRGIEEGMWISMSHLRVMLTHRSGFVWNMNNNNFF